MIQITYPNITAFSYGHCIIRQIYIPVEKGVDVVSVGNKHYVGNSIGTRVVIVSIHKIHSTPMCAT